MSRSREQHLDEEQQDFSAMEAPLNQAATILAARSGREWKHTIVLTKSIPPDEFHAGRAVCKLHPLTVTRHENLVELIERVFKAVDTMVEVETRYRKKAIVETKELVNERLTYLRRALKNGDFEDFLGEIIDRDWGK